MPKQNSFPKKPISVNWHFWPWCNMKCKFCFATFNDVKRIITKELALKVPAMLKDAGAEKLTLVGGEPMLCPYLGELLEIAKSVGLVTKIVSNGTNIDNEFLSNYGKYIDYITLSLDSSSNETEKKLGRGWGDYVDSIKETAKLIKSHNIQLQLNSVITKLNWFEDLNEIIREIEPTRWKVFQVLKISGQNNDSVEKLLITQSEFAEFINNHKEIAYAVFESNDLITGSYIMIDPIGRFFDNTTGTHRYSDSIFSVGVLKAFNQIIWQKGKFNLRNGFYYRDARKKSLFRIKRESLEILRGKNRNICS